MDVDRHLAGLPLGMVQPQVILPSQHFNPPEKLAPERRLMTAVLEDAIRCVEKYGCATDAQGRRIFLEAKRWLLVEEPDWPYSFERISEVLDLDANAVRHRLRLAAEVTQATHQSSLNRTITDGR